ncbi:MAG: hypothetical protein WD851_15225 [Pirellulales bacterium]
MNVQSLWCRFRQFLAGGKRSPRRRPRPPAPALRILRLERRRVLSADFSFGASGLILHGFDADGGETLTISQAETEYRFTLNNGDWSTPAGPSPDGVRLDGQTLAIEAALVDQLVDGLTVIGDAMTPLHVSLDQADFSAFQGPLSFSGIRSINQAANTQLAFGDASALEITAPVTGMTIGSLNVAGDLTITTFGPITDGDGTQINVTGNATFISRAFHPAADFDADGMVGPIDYGIWAANFGVGVGATKAQGDADGDGAVSITDYTAWRDTLGQVSEPGGIFLADNLTDQLNVGGQATFEAGDGATRFDIDVGALGITNFGSLAVIGANATVQEDSATEIVEVDAQTFSLASAGAITDAPGTTIDVTGLATFNAGANLIRLGDDAGDTTNFGQLRLTGGGVLVTEDSSTVLTDVTASSFMLTSAGAITDASTINIAGDANFIAGGPITLNENAGDVLSIGASATFRAGAAAPFFDITIGPAGMANFGSLHLTGDDVTVQEDSATVLRHVTASSLTLTSSGPISDSSSGGTTISVTNLATFDAGANTILLGDVLGDTTNFGQLHVTGLHVAITEDSGTELTGVMANSLDLMSAGPITDAPGTTITVMNLAKFTAAGVNTITLGDSAGDSTNFGFLTVIGGAVVVTEDSGTDLTGVTTTSLNLTSAGPITDRAPATISVTGLAAFNAGANAITLGDAASEMTNFGQLHLTGGAVAITEDSGTELTGVNATSLALTSAGPITDAVGTTISVTGLATLNAGANPITLGDNAADTTNFGQLNVTGGAVLIMEDSGTELTGINAATLSLVSTGPITDAAGTAIGVTGLATLNAGANPITLGDNAADSTNFGQLHVTGGAVAITEDSATVVTGVTATTLNLTSAGSITDAPGTAISVTGLATLNAGANPITLGDNVGDTTNFGQLHLTGGAVAIAEDSATVLTGVTATTLSLTSTGSVADAVGTTINVTGLATLNAGANPIAIGDNVADVTNFGQLHVTGGAVAISEDSGTELTGVTATTFALTSSGPITDAAGTTIGVTALATFNTGANPITLGDNAGDTTNFGQLNLTGGGIAISEDSGTELTGVTAASFNLTSAGAITDAVGTTINVAGLATLNAGANPITLGDNAADVTNFGQLNVTGGAVSITEDSGTALTGVNATSLSLTSAGAITDAAATTISVTGLATLNAGANAITLGDSVGDTTNFGQLRLTGSAVSIAEDSGTELTGVTAATLGLTSAGPITDAAGTIINVTGLATLNAGANPITLGENVADTTNFGQLNLTGGVVSLAEDSATVLTHVTANLLNLVSPSSITDTAATTISVTGLATLNAGANAITLGDNVGDTTNFGQLNVTGGAVAITEDSGTQLTGVTAATLNLLSAGPITDAPGTSISVSGLATLNAGANPITLGDSAGDTTNFGQLHLTGGPTAITEDSATVLTHVTASSLTLVSGGSITDVPGTIISVTGLATFNAGTDAITLGDSLGDVTNFGQLNVTGGAVNVTEDSSTELTGVTAATSFSLNSAGAITDTAAAIIFVDGPAIVIADGKITLADHNVMGTANSVIVTGLGSFQVTDGNNIDIGVIVPSGLPAAANAQLGSLQFTAIGGLVRVALDGPIILSGESAGGSAWLNAEGSITDAVGADTTITQFAILEAAAGSDIVLGDDSEFRMATSAAPLAAFDQSRFLAMQAENVSIQVDSGFNLSTSSNYNEFAGTVFLSAQGNISQVSHEGEIAPLDANRIAMFGAGAVLFSQVRVKSQVTADDSAVPNLAIRGGIPTSMSILPPGQFPTTLIPGSTDTDFSPIGFDGVRIVERADIGDDYSIIMKVLGDAKIGIVHDATGKQAPLIGIEVTDPAGNAYLQTTPDAGVVPEAGNIVFTSLGTAETIVTMLGGVFTAIAAGKLTIDTDQPDAAVGSRTTKLTSNTGTVTSVEEFSTFNGATGATVDATGPRFILDLPREEQNAATTGLVFSPEFEQRVTLAAGSRGEDNLILELEWADVQNRRDGRPSLPADFPGSNALPTITLVPQTVDGLAPEPLLQSSEPPLSFRVVTTRHNYSEAFIPKNPVLPQLPTTVRLYNDPAINLFDQFDGTDFRDLNSNSNFVSPRAVAVPTAGYFEITSAELPTTFDPPEPVVATAVTTVPQQQAVVDEIRVSASSDTETIRFGRVGEDGEFINEPGEEWPVEWQGGRDGDFLNEIREAVENSPSLEGLYRIESQTPRGEQPLEEWVKGDADETDPIGEEADAAEAAEAVDEQPPPEETSEPGADPAASVIPPAEQAGIEAAIPATAATEYRMQRGASHLASGQLLVGAAALAVCRWNHRLAANGPLDSREARADLSRAARRRRAWRKLLLVPPESDSEVAG